MDSQTKTLFSSRWVITLFQFSYILIASYLITTLFYLLSHYTNTIGLAYPCILFQFLFTIPSYFLFPTNPKSYLIIYPLSLALSILIWFTSEELFLFHLLKMIH